MSASIIVTSARTEELNADTRASIIRVCCTIFVGIHEEIWIAMAIVEDRCASGFGVFLNFSIQGLSHGLDLALGAFRDISITVIVYGITGGAKCFRIRCAVAGGACFKLGFKRMDIMTVFALVHGTGRSRMHVLPDIFLIRILIGTRGIRAKHSCTSTQIMDVLEADGFVNRVIVLAFQGIVYTRCRLTSLVAQDTQV